MRRVCKGGLEPFGAADQRLTIITLQIYNTSFILQIF
nr:hypothetical protein [Mucilaginibacter sp. FT3.2]